MAELDLSTELQQLRSTLGDIRQVIDLEKLETEIASLKERAAASDLWDNPEQAQKVTSALEPQTGPCEQSCRLNQPGSMTSTC
jgi:peptide chain release factor 2